MVTTRWQLVLSSPYSRWLWFFPVSSTFLTQVASLVTFSLVVDKNVFFSGSFIWFCDNGGAELGFRAPCFRDKGANVAYFRSHTPQHTSHTHSPPVADFRLLYSNNLYTQNNGFYHAQLTLCAYLVGKSKKSNIKKTWGCGQAEGVAVIFNGT